jgi:ABC-type molybdenum transport system ATPase subunit/photorepair protein PhrA
MITRLEATRYRCFERLGVDVGDFRVLVGANGSGKTTLLDLPVLLGDLLRANNVSSPFMERRNCRRACSLNELVFAGRGSDFSLAVEARLPEAVQSKVLEGLFASKRTERSRQALKKIPSMADPHPLRDRLAHRCGSITAGGLRVPLLLSRKLMGQTADKRAFTGETNQDKEDWHFILRRVRRTSYFC